MNFHGLMCIPHVYLCGITTRSLISQLVVSVVTLATHLGLLLHLNEGHVEIIN